MAVSPRDPRMLARGALIHGRYVVESSIAQRARSAIFRAHDSMFDRKVALKLFAPRGEPDDELALRRFLLEARVTCSLASENTVRVFDCAETGEGFVLWRWSRSKALRSAKSSKRAPGPAGG